MNIITHAVSVEALQAIGSCRNSANCSIGEDIGTMTIEQCCLNTTNGLAFMEFGLNICATCIGV